jgi:ribosomal protein L20
MPLTSSASKRVIEEAQADFIRALQYAVSDIEHLVRTSRRSWLSRNGWQAASTILALFSAVLGWLALT